MLAGAFSQAGREPLLVREPGGTPAGESIRHLLQHAPEGAALTPEAELLLFAASRAQLVREVIAPALAGGRVVLSDRFHDSTTVYQGVARRIPAAETARINAFAVGDCLPDLTFLLDVDRKTARRRMRNRAHAADRIEREPEEFFALVRRGYLDLAARESERIQVIDASETPECIFNKILKHLAEKKWLS